MKLMAFSDYALRTLMVLAARRGEIVTIAEIARAFGISEAHLMKVAHMLGKTPWVETVRGRGGGLRLVADPATMRLGDVIELLEGSFAVAECFTSTSDCRLQGSCGLAGVLARAVDDFRASLNKSTLADVVGTTAPLRRMTFVRGASAP